MTSDTENFLDAAVFCIVQYPDMNVVLEVLRETTEEERELIMCAGWRPLDFEGETREGVEHFAPPEGSRPRGKHTVDEFQHWTKALDEVLKAMGLSLFFRMGDPEELA